MRLIIGLIKGIIIGGLVGLGAYQLGKMGAWNWITYGVVGAVVGVLVGRPIWSVLADEDSTVWTVILKAAFGYGVAVGIYALVVFAWGGMDIAFQGETRNLYDWQPLFGGMIGGVWGAFVEFDDSPGKEKPSDKQ